MKFATHNDKPGINTNMSSLQGYIQATRANLIRVFGEPQDFGPGDKVSLQWGIEFADGTVATLYDWKRDEAPEIHEVYDWHIGGFTTHAVRAVHNAYREDRGLLARSA